MTDGRPDSEAGRPRRTEPVGLLVDALAGVKNGAIGLVALFVSLRDEWWGMFALAGFALLLLIASLGFSWLAWRRRTYTVGEADIRVESGVLSRSARSVPYERIQDVALEQAFLPRLFGLVQVAFDTGAGGKDDLKLAYLREAEGARLRELVRAHKDGAPPTRTVTAAGEPAEAAADHAEILFAMPPRRLATFGLFEFSLAAVAVIGGAAQQFDVLLPFDPWDFDEWEQRLAGPGQWLAGLGFAAQVTGGAIAVATLLALGFVTGLVRTVLRDWDFRLERTAKGLRRRRGLFTRTDVVMPAHRVQALKIGTGLLRRRFGWHSLRVVSLAQDSGSANHDVAPFAQLEEIAPIIRATGFDPVPADLAWQRPSPRAYLDGALGVLAVTVPVALLVAALSPYPWVAALPLAAGVLAALREALLWRVDRHAIDARQVYARRGWLAPRLAIASRVKLQSVEISQGPLARWRGYATLHCGLAGGRLAIEGIPLGRAMDMRAAILDSIGRTDFSVLLAVSDREPAETT